MAVSSSRSKSAVRSTSVDRSGGSLSLWTGATPAVAGQQLSQDASLCLFATPNSTAAQSRTAAAAAVAAASPLKSRLVNIMDITTHEHKVGCRLPRESECGSQFPLTVLNLICEGKSEGICNLFIIPYSSVSDSAQMLKLDVSPI